MHICLQSIENLFVHVQMGLRHETRHDDNTSWNTQSRHWKGTFYILLNNKLILVSSIME